MGTTPYIKTEEGLTYQKAVFARSYVTAMIANQLKRPNARECAIAAGCTKKTANTMAQLWLKCPLVLKSIERQMNDHMSVFDITANRILKEIASIAFANMGDYMTSDGEGNFFVDMSGLTEEQTAALAEVTVDEYTEGRGDAGREVKKIRFKLHDKKSALELLGKWKKLFTDKTELTGADGKPLNMSPVTVIIEGVASDGDGHPADPDIVET